MSKRIDKMKEFYKTNKKTSLAWYLTLRGLVIIIMVLRGLRGDWSSVFLCILTLIYENCLYFLRKSSYHKTNKKCI